MKKTTNIHNLDQLDREIYRLKLQAKNLEKEFDRNLDHLQENYFSMTMNSIFSRKKEDKHSRGGIFESFFKSDGFNTAIERLTTLIAEKAAAGIELLADRLFNKK